MICKMFTLIVCFYCSCKKLLRNLKFSANISYRCLVLLSCDQCQKLVACWFAPKCRRSKQKVSVKWFIKQKVTEAAKCQNQGVGANLLFNQKRVEARDKIQEQEEDQGHKHKQLNTNAGHTVLSMVWRFGTMDWGHGRVSSQRHKLTFTVRRVNKGSV